MEHWSAFDWFAYTSMWIGGTLLAVREATRNYLEAQNWFRKIFHVRWMAYAPLFFLFVSLGFFIARDRGIIRPESGLGVVTRPLIRPSAELGPHPWLAVAFQEFGERRYGSGNNNPHILTYFKSIPGTEKKSERDDWSSAFAEWSSNEVGISGPKNVAPRAWLNWGASLSEGREGCIVILSFRGGDEHIGFLLAQDDKTVVIYGGNTVDAVQPRRYQKSDVLAYRWPIIETPAARH